jgi:hypothetical protein
MPLANLWAAFFKKIRRTIPVMKSSGNSFPASGNVNHRLLQRTKKGLDRSRAQCLQRCAAEAAVASVDAPFHIPTYLPFTSS